MRKGLEIVRGDGLTDSEAVGTALREAAGRRRVRSAIREEVRRLAADERDREEMRIIREQLEELGPPLLRLKCSVARSFLPPPRAARGHEPGGARYAVIVQADEFLGLSAVLVSPTSTSARPANFRPTISVGREETRALVEQSTAVERNRWPEGERCPCAGVLVFAATEQERAMSLGNEVDAVFRREVKSLPAYEKARGASGSGIAPPVDEMNQLLMGLVIAAQRSLHLLADRIEQIENAKAT